MPACSRAWPLPRPRLARCRSQRSTPASAAIPASAVRPLAQRFYLGGQVSARVPGTNHAARLEQQDGGLGVGARAVLGTARHDEELARAERDVAVAHLDR